MARQRNKGALHTFLAIKHTADQPAEPSTPITLLHKDVLEATQGALKRSQAYKQVQAIPLGLAFEWALKGGRTSSSSPASRRQAILSIMEALAASEDFRQYARGPAVQYDVSGMWEAAVGDLKKHFTPRLKELLQNQAAAVTLPS